jgi:DNA (cytosine-5)-methyltransferase 1
MGLDLGFEKEEFNIKVALDIDAYAAETIRKNRPRIPVMNRDISNVETKEILETAGLTVGEAAVVTGGSPCQPFSTAGRRLSVNEMKGQLIFEFIRVVEEAKPKFFVFENVAGLISAAIKHISFYERIRKKEEELPPEQRLGSAFEIILDRFRKTHYGLSFGVLNAADYGVPQRRKRLIILGSREGKKVILPQATHGSLGSDGVLNGSKKTWTTLREALKDLKDPGFEHIRFPPSRRKYMRHIPQGGDWRDLPVDLQKEAMKGAYYSQGGRTGFFRRLSWDEPAPTLATSPVYKGTTLAHPKEDRPLSVREYARIQGFPDDWEFVGYISTKYRLIGEAVPIQLSRALARQILQELKRESGTDNETNRQMQENGKRIISLRAPIPRFSPNVGVKD